MSASRSHGVPQTSKGTETQQSTIRAEISGSDSCTALGITARGDAPVLKLRQLLVEAGYDPSTSLHAYRNDVLCLKARTIGEGAQLRTATHGVGFEPLRERTPLQNSAPTPPVPPADSISPPQSRCADEESASVGATAIPDPSTKRQRLNAREARTCRNLALSLPPTPAATVQCLGLRCVSGSRPGESGVCGSPAVLAWLLVPGQTR